MNLGISRSCIGDILMNENGCFIFCLEKMAPFLIQELKMVRHTQVSCPARYAGPGGRSELRDGERKRGISASGQRDFPRF